jgi:hypothetical protein
MARNLRALLVTALAANVLAGTVTVIQLATAPAGTGDGPTLLDCTIIAWLFELATQMGYWLCLLQCERAFSEEGQEGKKLQCIGNCLRMFLWLQVALMFVYLACVFAAVGWF